MHCRSCEILIERALLDIPNVKKVEASTRKCSAVISFTGEVDMQKVKTAVTEVGYEVGEDETLKWLTMDAREYEQLAVGALIFAIGFFVLRQFGITFAFGNSIGGGIVSALLLGLTAGVSTCMALIGGLTLAISARYAEKHPEATIMQRFRPHLFFNLGRIIGFFLLGGLLGSIGGFFVLGNMGLAIITILVAVVMLLLGIQLIEIFPKVNNLTPTLPPALGKWLGINTQHTKKYSHRGTLIAGALTFFLPCGFTQMMQVAAIASTGFIQGAIIMSVFALGTTPGLLGVGGLTSVIRGTAAKIFFKTAGLIVIAFAIFNFANGYRLSGFVPFWENILPPSSETSSPPTNPVTLNNDEIQIVNMTQGFGGYSPNEFVIKKGVPVRWIITSETTNSCAASIAMPAFGVQEYLKIGENIIEFTPEKTGEIRFSCGMGMYPGKFTVVD